MLIFLLLAAGAVVALASASSDASGTPLDRSNTPSPPLPQDDVILKRWNAYAQALGNTPASGISDYASAIDAAAVTMVDFNDARQKDREKFLSAVSAAFSPALAKWARDVMDFINKLGTPGGDSWDPAHLDQAKKCIESTLNEGWPIIMRSSDAILHQSYLGVQDDFCLSQDAMRALSAERGSALKRLWRQITVQSKKPQIAFLTRFSLGALVEDAYSDAAQLAFKKAPLNEGYFKGETSLTPWSYMAAIVAANTSGKPPASIINATLQYASQFVISVDPTTGYDVKKLADADHGYAGAEMNLFDVWNARAEIARVAFAFADGAMALPQSYEAIKATPGSSSHPKVDGA